MLKLDEGAWEVLGPDLEVTEGSQVHFRVMIGGRSAEIVATVAASPARQPCFHVCRYIAPCD